MGVGLAVVAVHGGVDVVFDPAFELIAGFPDGGLDFFFLRFREPAEDIIRLWDASGCIYSMRRRGKAWLERTRLMSFRPLCPLVEPPGLMRIWPQSSAISSTTIMRSLAKSSL